MSAKRNRIPQYGTVTIKSHIYFRTMVTDAYGRRVSLYGKTREELYDKEIHSMEQIQKDSFRKHSPTVAEYCEKWLMLQSLHIRATTLTDYTSKVRRHIIGSLGNRRIAEVTLDDIQIALIPVSQLSASVYKSVVVLYKAIFRSAKENINFLKESVVAFAFRTINDFSTTIHQVILEIIIISSIILLKKVRRYYEAVC